MGTLQITEEWLPLQEEQDLQNPCNTALDTRAQLLTYMEG